MKPLIGWALGAERCVGTTVQPVIEYREDFTIRGITGGIRFFQADLVSDRTGTNGCSEGIAAEVTSHHRCSVVDCHDRIRAGAVAADIDGKSSIGSTQRRCSPTNCYIGVWPDRDVQGSFILIRRTRTSIIVRSQVANGKSPPTRRYCHLISVNGCGGPGDDGEISTTSYRAIVHNAQVDSSALSHTINIRIFKIRPRSPENLKGFRNRKEAISIAYPVIGVVAARVCL